MKLLEDYNATVRAIYEYFGYQESWHVYPIDDNTNQFWQIDGSIVRSADYKEQLNDEDSGDYYEAEIRGDVYRKDDYTMICIDTHCDGNQFLAIFDNKLEVK